MWIHVVLPTLACAVLCGVAMVAYYYLKEEIPLWLWDRRQRKAAERAREDAAFRRLARQAEVGLAIGEARRMASSPIRRA